MNENTGSTALTAQVNYIEFLDNTFLDRLLRNYARAFFGKDQNPVVVTYGDPVSCPDDTPFRLQSLIDGRTIRVDDKHSRLEGKPGTIFITAERPRK